MIILATACNVIGTIIIHETFDLPDWSGTGIYFCIQGIIIAAIAHD